MRIEPLDLREARAAYKPVRPKAQFDGAQRNRLTAEWAFSVLSTNQEVGQAQESLVSASRNLAKNDPTMAKFLSSIHKNVFGPDGIRLQSRVMLQRGQRPNKEVNRVIEAAWKEWGKKENCTIDGRLSWQGVQRMAARVTPTDGDFFIRKVQTDSNPFGFALQIINSDLVDRSYGRDKALVLPNGNIVFMGIEMNPYGRVVAYHVFTRHPAEAGSGPRQRERIPAEEIEHVFLPIMDNQVRGIPWATPSMTRMGMLKGYVEAEVVAARIAASQMGFIEKEIDPNAEVDPNADYAGGQDMEVQPGSFVHGNPGEHLEMFKPEHPVSAFGEFVKGAKLDIAAGLDAAYMTLTGDVAAANYSSARVGLLDERDTWESLQGFFIENLCQPIFSSWLKTAFIAYPPFRVWLNGFDWKVYDQAEWHPRSFPWVDPEKDANAEILKLQNGFTTLHRILASQGYDFDETMEELAEEQKRIKELGLELGDPKAKAAEAQKKAQGGDMPPKSEPQQRVLTDFVMSAHKGK